MKFLTAILTLTLLGLSMSASSEEYEQADIYRDLRDQALALDAQTLDARSGVYALLMETGYEDAAVTIIAAADGSASMYFSNGGGLIGVGEYEQVREVVLETLSELGNYSSNLEKTETFPLPDFGRTRFYAVTDQGVLTADAANDVLGNEKHELSPLFHQVHKLISYMRVAEEHRRSQESE